MNLTDALRILANPVMASVVTALIQGIRQTAPTADWQAAVLSHRTHAPTLRLTRIVVWRDYDPMPTIASELSAFLDDLARRVQLRPATLRAYHGDLAAAAAPLVDELATSTPRQIELVAAESTPSRATVAQRMSSLKRFFGRCVRHDRCPTNPVERCEMVTVDAGVARPDLARLDASLKELPEPHQTILWMLPGTWPFNHVRIKPSHRMGALRHSR